MTSTVVSASIADPTWITEAGAADAGREFPASLLSAAFATFALT